MKDKDEFWMKLALDEARQAERLGNLPIGAVLIINDELVVSAYNNQNIDDNWSSHAEVALIRKYGSQIKQAKKQGNLVELYSTLEPCLMCFGASVHNRVGRIIYACPDPCAGATNTNPPTPWYADKWPKIRGNVLRDEAFNLFFNYINKEPEKWLKGVKAFSEMRDSWKI